MGIQYYNDHFKLEILEISFYRYGAPNKILSEQGREFG